MKKKNNSQPVSKSPAEIETLRRKVEATATFGMLIVAVGLALPFVQTMVDPGAWLYSEIGRWIYAFGAVIFTISRMVKVDDPADTMRIRRLSRLQFWAGVAFLIGGGLWFYQSYHRPAFGIESLQLIPRDAVLFTLVGAAIQLIASWMIYFARKKASEK